MSVEITPVTGVIGAVVDGADLSSPLSDDVAAQLHRALMDHLVLFFRGQALTDEQHLAFASRFGIPNVYPATRARGLDVPLEWIEDTADSPPKTDLWHTDVAFLPEPPEVGVINLLVNPPVGGDTMWASLYAAHDGLSPAMQEVLAPLQQELHPGEDMHAKIVGQFGAAVWDAIAAEFAGAVHPLVRVHPVTGRRALFLCGAYVRGIAGMRKEESDALLAVARARLEDPNLQCRWRWHEGDVAVWDERCTNHRALSDHFPHHRLIRRCTVGASRPVGPQ